MGHYYPGVELGKVTMPQLRAYMDAIPDLEHRRHASLAQISWQLANFTTEGKAGGSPDDYLPGFAKEPEDIPGPHYSAQEALELRWALKKELISQDMLDLLDWSAIKRSLPEA